MRRLLYILFCCTTLPSATAQVPVLCYHNIVADGSHTPSTLYISATAFRQQMQTLADSGYQTVSPGFLLHAKTFPSKAVVITFDDSHASHFSTAAPILEKTGFRGLFFVMTVTIGKKGYLSAQEIRSLHEHGHWIGSHTWDHPRLTALQGMPDAKIQLYHSKTTLERITGAPVTTLAYPFGAWNEQVVSQVQQAGYQAAFQLSGRQMAANPAFSIRRMMVDGRWSGVQLIHAMHGTFK